MDSRQRFTAAAAAYDAGRPHYPAALIDWVLAEAGATPPARVADIGCGTGIAARDLAARGFEVTGVEPNPGMRAEAERLGGGPAYVAGDAVASGLPEATFALVYAAQAFHYFPVAATMREWRRVLAPGGSCAAFWYRLARSPLKDAFRALRLGFSPPAAAPGGDRATRKADIADGCAAAPMWRRCASGISDTWCRWTDRGMGLRLASSSALAAAGGPPELAAEIDALFDRFQDGGRVSLRLKSTALVWRMS